MSTKNIIRVNLLLALIQPVASVLNRLIGKGNSEEDEADKYAGPLTPAPQTFAIWGPLFLSSIANSIAASTPENRQSPLIREVSIYTGAAFLQNILWSLNSQFLGLGWQSVALISGAAAVSTKAAILAGNSKSEDFRWVSYTIAPLAGWLTLATFVNIETTSNRTSAKLTNDKQNSRALLLLSGALATATFANTRKVHPIYNLPIGIGLVGVMVKNVLGKNKSVAVASGIGIVILGYLSLLRKKRK